MELAATILAFIGTTVLTIAFIPQAKLVYTLKHTYGISKASGVQNYIGRLAFALYYALTPVSLTVLPTVIGNVIIAFLSVPMIYYALRNHKTKGEYVPAHFSHAVFFLRLVLDVILLIAAIVIILMTATVDVIHVAHDSKIFNLVAGIVATGILSTAFFSQTLKTIRTRKTSSLSLSLLVLFIVGNIITTCSFGARVEVAQDLLGKIQYLGPIMWISLSTIAMVIIVVIKLINRKTKRE